MRKPIIFMFSGQGSQYYQMARELFLYNSLFREIMSRMDERVKEMTGQSVIEELYLGNHRPTDSFQRTLITHPAIFMVEYALAQVLLEKGIKPDYVLGTSLGEYTATAVAGVLPPEDVLECIVRQAQLVEQACLPGCMLTILHPYHLFYDLPELYRKSELAAIHFDSHFVVSGEKGKLMELEKKLQSLKVLCQMLPISYGFHSSYIEPIAEQYKSILRSKFYKKPSIPYISCVEGKIKENLGAGYLWEVARKPIQFSKALQAVKKECHEPIFFDLGPRGTLAQFLKYNYGPDYPFFANSIITPNHQEIGQIEIAKTIYSLNEQIPVGQKVYV